MNELQAMADLQKLSEKEEQEKKEQLRDKMMGLEQQSVLDDNQQRFAYKDKAIGYMRSYEASLVQSMNAQAQRVEVKSGPPDDAQPEAAPAAEEKWKDKRTRVARQKKAAADIRNYVKRRALHHAGNERTDQKEGTRRPRDRRLLRSLSGGQARPARDARG